MIRTLNADLRAHREALGHLAMTEGTIRLWLPNAAAGSSYFV